MNKRRFNLSFLAAASIALIALTGSSLPPVQPKQTDGQASTQAAYLQVSVSCSPGGGYGWNVTIVDGAANSSYFVQNIYTYEYKSGSIGGSYQYTYAGQVATGQYGIGTSSTFYGNAGSTVAKVSITARAAGLEGSGSDTC